MNSYRLIKAVKGIILFIASLLLASCASNAEYDIKELHRKYMEASNSHDHEILASMTAEDAVWIVGPYRFEGKDDVLRPHRLDEGVNSRFEYKDVVVRGDTVEFVLMERSEVSDHLEITAHNLHYPRFIFRNGLIVKKEPWKKYVASPGDDQNIYADYQKWVREERPEERKKFINPEGKIIWSYESGVIMSRLAREYAVIQSIKQIHQIAANAKRDGDVTSFIELFTEDGIYMWPGEPAIAGRAALHAWFMKRFSQFYPEAEKKIEEIVVTGDWAFERGREVVSIRNRATGEVQVMRGKYVNMFRQQTNGSWKIAWRIRNSDHPVQSGK